MPPRSPAVRRRPGSCRAAHVSNVGICITDAMLIKAIEKYQKLASETRRRFYSHVGPLESRRRASKRHMTGLMPTSHTFPPIWQFDIGSSRLQWEAPTSQEHRRRKRDQLSVSGVLNTFVGWLGIRGATDKPFDATPVSPSDTTSGVVRLEAPSVESFSAESMAKTEQEAHTPAPFTTMPEEIVLLRSSILDMHPVKEDARFFGELYQAAKACKRCLRRRIERGDLSAQGLVVALDPLDSTSRSRIPTAEMANKISAMIRRGVLYAMADVQTRNPAAIPPELWLNFVDKLCSANGGAHDVQLLRNLLGTMPASLKHHLPAEQMRSLTRRIVTAQAHRQNLFPQWLVLASRFSQALQQLPGERQREMDDDMAAFLSQQDGVSDTAKRMRYAWLVIKAHAAHTSTQDFTDLYRNCLGPEHRLNGLQRWQVIFARLSALQTFDSASRKQLLDGAYTSLHQRWSTLLAHVMSSANKESALRELCAALSGIGEFASTARTLTSPPVHELERETMEALATACGSHDQVLFLHDAIDMKPRANRPQPLWSWTTWTKHTEAIIKDPAIDSCRIWQVLKLTYTPRCITADKGRLAHEKTAKCHFLTQMAQWFLQAQHLNDRQVLRNLQRCLNMHRALTNGAVPHQMLVCVVEIISRDLERGQRGRTSRMEWLLRLTLDKYGLDAAKKVASAWKGFRWTIENIGGPRLDSPMRRRQ
ncbi:hypothetical protein E4U42_007247 [Claviceps africana]|uniref:Fungal specific transcription factor domain containing protein n=1 Tax=Claviceps africana TaxID=83212 RepID=A0A8K0J1D0_9HYPO|nr:hypothetical protein E4U42_007247 [Claviceps africana]